MSGIAGAMDYKAVPNGHCAACGQSIPRGGNILVMGHGVIEYHSHGVCAATALRIAGKAAIEWGQQKIEDADKIPLE